MQSRGCRKCTEGLYGMSYQGAERHRVPLGKDQRWTELDAELAMLKRFDALLQLVDAPLHLLQQLLDGLVFTR